MITIDCLAVLLERLRSEIRTILRRGHGMQEPIVNEIFISRLLLGQSVPVKEHRPAFL